MRRLYSLVCVAGGWIVLIASLTACDDGPFGPSFPSGTADGDDGRELLLKMDSYDCWNPVVSPDGNEVAFNKTSINPTSTEMCILNINTGGVTKLLDDAYPNDWSPDGEWIVYRTLTGFGDIWLIHPDGTGNRPLVTSSMAEGRASFSPDSSQVGFESYMDFPDLPGNQIYVIDIDGGEPRRITSGDGSVHYFATTWSPGGEWFAFLDEVVREGSDGESRASELYIISVDGKDQRRLVPQDPVWWILGLCGWTPDGRGVILSMAERLGKDDFRKEFWLYYLKDNSLRQLTFSNSTGTEVDSCDWRPDGTIVMSIHDWHDWSDEKGKLGFSLWTIDAPY
jgi:Tol biopolymer transport system component